MSYIRNTCSSEGLHIFSDGKKVHFSKFGMDIGTCKEKHFEKLLNEFHHGHINYENDVDITVKKINLKETDEGKYILTHKDWNYFIEMFYTTWIYIVSNRSKIE